MLGSCGLRLFQRPGPIWRGHDEPHDHRPVCASGDAGLIHQGFHQIVEHFGSRDTPCVLDDDDGAQSAMGGMEFCGRLVVPRHAHCRFRAGFCRTSQASNACWDSTTTVPFMA